MIIKEETFLHNNFQVEDYIVFRLRGNGLGETLYEAIYMGEKSQFVIHYTDNHGNKGKITSTLKSVKKCLFSGYWIPCDHERNNKKSKSIQFSEEIEG